MKEIFISHSSLDVEIVNDFIDDILISGIGISRDQIYSTSADDLKHNPGEDWIEEIKKALLNSKVVIIFMSLNYRKSEFCLMELAAVWLVSSERKQRPIFFTLGPVSTDNLPAVLTTKEVKKLLDPSHLNTVGDYICSLFDKKTSTNNWDNKKNLFIEKGRDFLRNHPPGKLGLVDSYPKSNDTLFLKDMLECIEHAKEEIKLVGLCLNFFVTVKQKHLHMIIEKSKELKSKPVICFGHPSSYAVRCRKTGDYSQTPADEGLSVSDTYINDIRNTSKKPTPKGPVLVNPYKGIKYLAP